MKKVLALVLAVIMVCTMAMAAPVAVTPIGGVSADGTITLESSTDLTKTYGVEIPTEYYPSKVVGSDLSKITFEGSNVQLSNGSFYLIVPVADKPLDTKADFSVASLTVKKDANNYIVYTAKAGKLEVSKVVKDGLVTDPTGLVDLTNNKLSATYDIGYAPAALGSDVTASGWYTNNATTPATATITGQADVIVTVPAKATVKITLNDVPSSVKFSTGNALVGGVIRGASITGGSIKMEVTGNYSENVYGVAADGTLLANPTRLVVNRDMVTGYETAKWVASGTSVQNIVKLQYAEKAVGTTTPGTTTNPGTGANDVVGVAAALAVVALVSGAAISLKK